MARDGGYWAARIYVTPKIVPEAITVSIRGIASGPRSDPRLSELVAVRRIPEHGPISAFDVMTRDGADISRGVYDILLNVAATSREPEQTLTIQVTVPAAALKQPPGLVLFQVLGLFGAPSVLSPPLLVSETGRVSPASLQIVQQSPFSDDTGSYDGQLKFDSVTMQAGKTVQIPYTIRGTFPLGSAKSSLSVTAPELDSPISIPVEVRTRRTRLLLLIVIVLGLALGFLMRTALKQRIQFGEAREKALELAKKLEQEREDVPDVDFGARVDRALRTLLLVVESSRIDNTPKLTDAAGAAEKSLADAQADLQRRASETADELKAMMLVAKTSWRLPGRILAELQNAVTALITAQELNKTQNPAGARQLLDTTRESLARAIFGYATSFKEDIPDFENFFTRATTLLSPTQREAFSSAISSMTTLSNQIQDRSEDDGTDTLKSVLIAENDSIDSVRRIMAMLRLGTLETLRTIEGSLLAKQQVPGKEWKIAEKTTTDFMELLRSTAEDPVAAGLAEKVQELFSAWRQAFQHQDVKKGAAEIAGNGDLIGAANLIQEPRETVQGSRVASEELRVVAAWDSITLEAAGETRPVSEPVLFESFYPRRRKQLTTEVLEANTLRQLLRARGLMTGLSAIGLALVGYLLFADKFVGTSGDLMTAFFWGFTSDIGLDALITAATTKKS
jgi:hypothetical protein